MAITTASRTIGWVLGSFILAAIQRNPNHYQVIKGRIRCAVLRRFPYSLLFRVMPNGIYVIACFHSSRDPEIWQRRV